MDITDADQDCEESVSFNELSMREDYRVDIRRGPSLTAAENTVAYENFRSNPSVLKIVSLCQHSPRTKLHAGNFGRWNFNGDGPSAPPPPPRQGSMGCIVTMPGAGDQAVHADCPHIFDHAQLPPHYINMFGIGRNSGFDIGQTAFIRGSHKLQECAIFTENKAEMNRHLVRPHLKAGDIVMFDCRILHFGTSNSGDAWRPVVYTNYWREFYEDPKNWDARKKLFGPENSSLK